MRLFLITENEHHHTALLFDCYAKNNNTFYLNRVLKNQLAALQIALFIMYQIKIKKRRRVHRGMFMCHEMPPMWILCTQPRPAPSALSEHPAGDKYYI